MRPNDKVLAALTKGRGTSYEIAAATRVNRHRTSQALTYLCDQGRVARIGIRTIPESPKPLTVYEITEAGKRYHSPQDG